MNRYFDNHPELRLQEYEFMRPGKPVSENLWMAACAEMARLTETTQPDFADPQKENLQ